MGNTIHRPLPHRSLVQLPASNRRTENQATDMELKQADNVSEGYIFGATLKDHGLSDNRVWLLSSSVLKSWKRNDSTYTESGNDSGRQTAVLYALANIRRDSVELDTAEQDILRVSCFCDALSDVTLDVTTPSPNIEIMSLNMQPAGTGRAPSSSATFLNLPAGYGHQIEIHLRFKTSEDGNTCFKTLTTESTTGKPDSGMGFEESDCNIPSISVLLRVTASIGKGILQEHHTQLSILADSDKGYRAVVDTQETIFNGFGLVYTPLYGGSMQTRSDASEGYAECVVCLSEPKCATLLPCQHLSLCKSCAFVLKMQRNFQNRKCPVCRTAIYSILMLDT